jgi:nucleolar protein 58
MAPVYVLGENAAGYALFKSSDKKVLKRSDLANIASSVVETCNLLKLKKFAQWDSAATGLSEVTAIGDGKVTPMLAEFLTESLQKEKKATLVVADAKLGAAIGKLPDLSVQPVSDTSTLDIFRALREHVASLIPDLAGTQLNTMSLGLAHSVSRHKLRFSPDKVDTMIIQAISLLDDLDKDLNMYAMRVKEWYGWHFPEMAKIINDNLAYARVVLKVGMRSNASSSDLSEILPEEIEGAVKAAAEISMGTEITDEDLSATQALAEQVVALSEHRALLSSYLAARMQAIAPNLTAIVGDLVGARLIAHAGSLSNLSKNPSSTIQILGAEKALFRALKTKHDTPKYGLIYHATLVGQASGKNKGKMARTLAAKATLSLRIDSLDSGKDENGDDLPEDERAAAGTHYRRYLERKLQNLEGRPITGKGVSIAPNKQLSTPGKFDVKEARKYNAKADGLEGPVDTPVNRDEMELDKIEASAAAEQDESSSEESGSESDEEEAEDTPVVAPPPVNGEAKKLSKEERKALYKEAKKARKAAGPTAEQIAAREAKVARRAEKEAKKAERRAGRKAARLAKAEKKRVAHREAERERKRKRETEEERGEGKKKVKKMSVSAE